MSMASSRGARDWSRFHIAAHWTTVGLVAVQLISAGSMAQWVDAADGAAGTGAATLAVLHAASGVSIVGLTLLRILDRSTRGRPPYPPDHPAWAKSLSKANHFLLYAVLVVMPLLGAAALVSGSDRVGGLHAAFAPVLLALVALHVAGALAEHFWFKNDLLRRMLGRGPSRDGEAPLRR